MGTIFTDAGEGFIADLVDGGSSKPANYYIGWGTGSTPAAKGDAVIEGESPHESRASATLSQPSADTNRFVGTIQCATSGKTIANAGVLTASANGALVIHGDFTGIALNVGDSIQFTYELTYS